MKQEQIAKVWKAIAEELLSIYGVAEIDELAYGVGMSMVLTALTNKRRAKDDVVYKWAMDIIYELNVMGLVPEVAPVTQTDNPTGGSVGNMASDGEALAPHPA